ncbi:MAG: T9SS type A sorting domain-containing protein, partial [Bacteroidota bacterium]
LVAELPPHRLEHRLEPLLFLHLAHRHEHDEDQLVTLQVFAQCTEDCVWPGDLDANGVATTIDFLTLGYAFGATGSARTDATGDWTAQTAADWVGTFPLTGVNYKHADANGDGEVTVEDRIPIVFNYFQTNDNFTGFKGNNFVGDDLFLVPLDSVATPGGTLRFAVHLGRETAPIADVYGIGFRVEMEDEMVELVSVNAVDNWLGVADEVLWFDKYSDDQSHLGFALTRLDGQQQSGFGQIAEISIVVTDVILGLEQDSTACIPFPLRFSYVLGTNFAGEDLLITSRSDSLELKHPSQLTTVTETDVTRASIQLQPNPASGQVQFRFQGLTGDEQVHLYDVRGQWRKSYSLAGYGAGDIQLDVSDQPPGLYWLTVSGPRGRLTHKLVLE